MYLLQTHEATHIPSFPPGYFSCRTPLAMLRLCSTFSATNVPDQALDVRIALLNYGQMRIMVVQTQMSEGYAAVVLHDLLSAKRAFLPDRYWDPLAIVLAYCSS